VSDYVPNLLTVSIRQSGVAFVIDDYRLGIFRQVTTHASVILFATEPQKLTVTAISERQF
jgi:hypothetical protein